MFICVAAPPGGGRSELTTRFTRHCVIVNMPDSSENTLKDIFSNILTKFLKTKMFRKEIIEMGESKTIVEATLAIYT